MFKPKRILFLVLIGLALSGFLFACERTANAELTVVAGPYTNAALQQVSDSPVQTLEGWFRNLGSLIISNVRHTAVSVADIFRPGAAQPLAQLLPQNQLAQTVEVTPLPGTETVNKTTSTSGSVTTQVIERQITPIQISVSVSQNASNSNLQTEINALQSQFTAFQQSQSQVTQSIFQVVGQSSISSKFVTDLLTDANIPNNITVSGYLPVAGGSLSGDLGVGGVLSVTGTATSSVSGPLTITTTTATSSFSGGLTVAATSGVFGIGTTTPGAALAVAGNAVVGGNTTIVGNLDIQGSCTGCGGSSIVNLSEAGSLDGFASTAPWGVLSVEQISSNNTNLPAFIVSDQGTSTASLIVMNNNGYVGIGTNTPSERFTVGKGNFLNPIASTTPLAGVDFGSDAVEGMAIVGRYAYVVTTGDTGTCTTSTFTGCEFKIIDLHNIKKPAIVGGYDLESTSSFTDGGESIAVYGRYAYVGKYQSAKTCSQPNNVKGCELVIFDISNPASTTVVSGTNFDTVGIRAIQTNGRYAYIGTSRDSVTCSVPGEPEGCDFQVYDVSNVASTTFIGGTDLKDGVSNIGVTINGVQIRGKYAYVAKSESGGETCDTTYVTCEFVIYDISDPTNPTAIGGADLGPAANSQVAYGLAIQGRYAYITTDDQAAACTPSTGNGCGLLVFDISNPASPSLVNGFDIANNSGSGVIAFGHYLVVTNSVNSGNCTGQSDCTTSIFDISNPNSPSFLAGVDTGEKGVVSDGFLNADGRYLFMYGGENSTVCSGTDVSGCELRVYDLGGSEIGSANIGSLEAGIVSTQGDLTVGGNARIASGLNVGFAGIGTEGTLMVASSSSFFGPIGVGTTSPQGMVAIDNSVAGTKMPALLIKAGGTGNGNIAIAVSSTEVCKDTVNVATCVLNDLAELYPASGQLEGGDIVAFDSGAPINVKKAGYDNREQLAGVLSTNPAIVFEGSKIKIMGGSYQWEGSSVPVALSGRIPVKVSLDNGPIHIGDPITISTSTPGVGVKATESGKIIGYALENLDTATTAPGVFEKVMIFANLTYWQNPKQDSQSWLAAVADWLKGAVVTIQELFVGKLTVGTPDQPAGITMYDQATGQPYCFGLRNGAAEYVPGACGSAASVTTPSSPSDPSPSSSDSATSTTTPDTATPDTVVPDASGTPSQ